MSILTRLIIFNTNDGQDESHEADKLIYHWSKDGELKSIDKINEVCLCDASVNVGHKLNPNENRANKFVLQFEKTKLVILEVEPDLSIWIAAHVELDAESEASSSISQDSISRIIEQTIINIYDRFCLLHGGFKLLTSRVKLENTDCDDPRLVKDVIRNELRKVCSTYFDSILPEFHLSSYMNNIASLYNNIHYLQLNQQTLMRVNSFMNHIVCLDARQIRHTILLFSDQLICSSLTLSDTSLVYDYLVSVIIKNAVQEELSKVVDIVRCLHGDLKIYLSEVDDHLGVTTSRSGDELAPEHTMKGKKRRNFEHAVESYLTIFRSRNLTFGLILNEVDPAFIQQCEILLTSDSELGVIPLASLAQSIGLDYLKTRPVHDNDPTTLDYILMDRLDSSIESQSSSLTLEASAKRPQRLVKYLLETKSEFEKLEEDGWKLKEMYGRTTGDFWLTVTNCLFITVYCINYVRNSSLTKTQSRAWDLKRLLVKNLASIQRPMAMKDNRSGKATSEPGQSGSSRRRRDRDP